MKTQNEVNELLKAENVPQSRLGQRQIDELLNKSHFNKVPTDQEIEDSIMFKKFNSIIEMEKFDREFVKNNILSVVLIFCSFLLTSCSSYEIKQMETNSNLKKYSKQLTEYIVEEAPAHNLVKGTKGMLPLKTKDGNPLDLAQISSVEPISKELLLNEVEAKVNIMCRESYIATAYIEFIDMTATIEVAGKNILILGMRKIEVDCDQIKTDLDQVKRTLLGNTRYWINQKTEESNEDFSHFFTTENPIPNKYRKNKYIMNAIINKLVYIGMPEEALLLSWGEPDDINKSVYSFGVHKQYVYGNSYVYIEDGIVTSYQN